MMNGVIKLLQCRFALFATVTTPKPSTCGHTEELHDVAANWVETVASTQCMAECTLLGDRQARQHSGQQ